MPLTPYHMGPGILFKSSFQGWFSILLFGWTQILIDLQPLIVLITGAGNSHGLSHTFVGSFVIAIFAGVSGKYIFEGIFKIIKNKTNFKNLNIAYSWGYDKYVVNLLKDFNIIYSWPIIFLSTFIGSFSHIILDALCHPNMTPFYPFNQTNPLYNIISYRSLIVFCKLTGLIGIFLYSIIKLVRYKKL